LGNDVKVMDRVVLAQGTSVPDNADVLRSGENNSMALIKTTGSNLRLVK